MRLYLTHSTSYDFRAELYAPIKHSLTLDHKVVFPHDTSNDSKDSKEAIKDCNAVLAEVSFPSTGQGIELGWANYLGKSIICLHKKGTKPSSALRVISNSFIEYDGPEDMIQKLNNYLASPQINE